MASPSKQRIKQGRRGERIAARYLKKQGYRILERNKRLARGELDIVAMDGQTLCFIEVRTLKRGAIINPLEAITKTKRRQVCRVVHEYLSLNQNLLDYDIRFDAVGVLVGWMTHKIHIVKDAWREDDI